MEKNFLNEEENVDRKENAKEKNKSNEGLDNITDDATKKVKIFKR